MRDVLGLGFGWVGGFRVEIVSIFLPTLGCGFCLSWCCSLQFVLGVERVGRWRNAEERWGSRAREPEVVGSMRSCLWWDRYVKVI